MKVQNIQIRFATEADANELLELNEEFNGVGITLEEVIDNLSLSSELVAIAFLDNLPVAFICAQCFKSVCYSNSYAEITEVYIRKHARRKGIATLLLSFVEEELKARGVRAVKVITGKNNDIAIKAYEKSNFVLKEEQVLYKKLQGS